MNNKPSYKQSAEVRSMEMLELRASKSVEGEEENYIVEGYAAKYEPYILFYDWDDKPVYEQFSKENFENADTSDVIFQLNHGGMVYARTKNNTLSLFPDDKGLRITANLGKTEQAKQIYEAIKAGMLDKMSWRFSVKADGYQWDKETNTISYTPDGIRKIYDVSVVDIPANADTEIGCGARNFFNGVIEEERIRSEIEHNKQKRIAALQLRLRLNMEVTNNDD